MRRRLLIGLLLVAPLAHAAEPSVVFHDWTTGSFAAGALLGVDGVTSRDLAFVADGCHRHIQLDLLLDAAEVGASVPDVGSVRVPAVVRAELREGDALLASRAIETPGGHGFALGTVPAAGPYAVRLVAHQGVDVAYEARVRGWNVVEEPACEDGVVLFSELDANPEGTDHDHEWVELWTPGTVDVDVAGWVVGGTAGTPSSFVLPAGSVVPADGVLVVTLAGQVLDNVDEVTVLLDASGAQVDATPTLSDEHNDARSWQHDGALGTWTFAAATPGTR